MSFRRRSAIGVVTVVLSLLAVFPARPANAEDWPHWRGPHLDGISRETVWKSQAMQNHFASAVLHEGYLYGFSTDRLRCVDFNTGEIKWEETGLGWGSLVLADGRLFILGDHGQLVLAKATPAKYTEVSRCQVFDKETLTWTVPVLSGGRLFVRSENALLAFDLRGKAQ
jgi:hypothetical protein